MFVDDLLTLAKIDAWGLRQSNLTNDLVAKIGVFQCQHDEMISERKCLHFENFRFLCFLKSNLFYSGYLLKR